ncbi:MAG: 1-deoxy-D-xylulose-5-phosphate synthase N-terminal domain-containing protein [Propionicimonas sp.]
MNQPNLKENDVTSADVLTSGVDLDLVRRLEDKAAHIRKQIAMCAHKMGTTIHLGGPLSAVDVVVALYYEYLGFDPENLKDPDRNKFVLSKGHNGVLLYNILADLGLYNWDEVFEGYNRPGHPFGMHPNRQHIKGIEASTGSLGHGLSLAAGMAVANRADGRTSRIYVMTGDGEMEEGSNWEALMYAGSHKLGNLVNILDFNHSTGAYRYGDNMVVDWANAYTSFGWDVLEINGNDMEEVVGALGSLPPVDWAHESRPVAIISNTIKGYGIDFMNGPKWHLGAIDDEKLALAVASIDRTRKVRN